MNIPTAIVFATTDCLALHLQKQGSDCGRVSEVRFNSLKSSRDSSHQYRSKKMHPRQLFLGRVSIATGVRDSTTNKNKRFKGFRPQLNLITTSPGSRCGTQRGFWRAIREPVGAWVLGPLVCRVQDLGFKPWVLGV